MGGIHQFLSTPPSRVATAGGHAGINVRKSFYPRHPRGWRHHVVAERDIERKVSIHATLAGGDRGRSRRYKRSAEFLSTPPSRVATRLSGDCKHYRSVSIHATLAGGAAKYHHTSSPAQRFYPRHPRGWRLTAYADDVQPADVSIHATLAGGDAARNAGSREHPVSIHATLAGGDRRLPYRSCPVRGFYPRHPRGWRLCVSRHCLYCCSVSIHATLAGGDRERMKPNADFFCFYPRHPRGWRRCRYHRQSRQSWVSIHATLAGGDLIAAPT